MNDGVAQIAQAICNLGPDIPNMSTMLNQHKETVRYRYKRFILGNGFTVHAEPNLANLGLKRVVVVTRLDHTVEPVLRPFVDCLNDSSYLVSFSRSLPDWQYTLDFSIPAPKLYEILCSLKRLAFLKDPTFYLFDWTRTIPMRAEHYDFVRNRWDFGWHKVDVDPGEGGSGAPDASVRFDRLDLMIIRELQYDANTRLCDMPFIKGVNYKTAAWHAREHVLGRKLIKNFRINWAGTTYDRSLGKPRHRSHSYLFLDVLVKDVAETERMRLTAAMSQTPFIFSEAGGQDYAANLAFPIENTTETYRFLGKVLSPVKGKTSCMILDPRQSVSYGITPELYDPGKREWTFDGASMVRGTEASLKALKQEA